MTNGEKFMQVYDRLPFVIYDAVDNITEIKFPGDWWDDEYINPEESEGADE